MRKHARHLALFATLSLLSSIPLSAGVAGAHGLRYRAQAPPTAENFERLRECESEGDYHAETRSRYFGAYQFSLSTWQSLGYAGLPHQAPPEVQDEAARELHDRRGWRPWPGCSRKLRLR